MSQIRYVLLGHTGIAEPHVDLMFETSPGSMLRSFRLPAWPIEGEVVAEAIGEHRREYLDYEGEVGGGRGEVKRIARGSVFASVGEERIEMFPIGGKPQELVLRKEANGGWKASINSLQG